MSELESSTVYTGELCWCAVRSDGDKDPSVYSQHLDTRRWKKLAVDIHIYRYQMSHWAILFDSIINNYISKKIGQIGRRYTVLLKRWDTSPH